MVGIVIATHGDLANGFMDSINIIMGSPENISVATLKNDKGIEGFNVELRASLNNVISDDGILILSDIKGGTPYNSSCYYAGNGEFNVNIKVVSGINLPMLLEVLSMREHSNLDELVKIALNAGITGIDIPTPVDGSLEYEDEL
ncbi:hypothetical protein [Clostridium sp. JN-9]|uniref:PTS sugar transporter subunit IIA n=1 Tax=Clostridium sp. JN-9 TaxID=2507159 RepID=UPI000FFE306F|nr:hypothetical protein [Clostridium sp. JN-9]QAT39192.1 hypothetical protein EQM05_02385 [Clostridium sp. JN-9]